MATAQEIAQKLGHSNADGVRSAWRRAFDEPIGPTGETLDDEKLRRLLGLYVGKSDAANEMWAEFGFGDVPSESIRPENHEKKAPKTPQNEAVLAQKIAETALETEREAAQKKEAAYQKQLADQKSALEAIRLEVKLADDLAAAALLDAERVDAQYRAFVESQKMAETARAESSSSRRKRLLYGLFWAATSASVWNMYKVMSHLFPKDDLFSPVALTVVFASAAVFLTMAGIRHRATVGLIFGLVGFELFCNVVNIYGRLFDHRAAKSMVDGAGVSEFLANAHALLGGFDASIWARVIATFCGLGIAGLQYVAIQEINGPFRLVGLQKQD